MSFDRSVLSWNIIIVHAQNYNIRKHSQNNNFLISYCNLQKYQILKACTVIAVISHT